MATQALVWFAAGVVLLGLWLARSLQLGPVVARIAEAETAKAIGGQARIARAIDGWLGDAQLEGVELQDPGGSVQARRIEADFGFGLLRGDASA